jgi:hypothetical protein
MSQCYSGAVDRDVHMHRLEKHLAITANIVRTNARMVRKLLEAQHKSDQKFDRLIEIMIRPGRTSRRPAS